MKTTTTTRCWSCGSTPGQDDDAQIDACPAVERTGEHDFRTDTMAGPSVGSTTEEGNCAFCGAELPAGERVYCDSICSIRDKDSTDE